ncbi:MAG TPA: enolase C-terminal domain-like protein [Candidatus Bathyarchaeia archaeon]|nr:enolase C-terminal domain-like protein [Candidatus Bathyarchaeia archaeon]
MKITGVKAHVLQPDRRFLPTDGQNSALIRILTDEGVEGNCLIDSIYAEELVRRFADENSGLIGAFPNLTPGEPAAKLTGGDPFDREKMEQYMFSRYFWQPMNNATVCALDECLWDIAGKALKLPVHKLIGTCRDQILAYASTQDYGTEREYIDCAIACQKAGYKAIKIHPFRNWQKDLNLCRAIREAVGDDMTLMFDPFCAYSREQALKVGKELDKLNFHWYEDPIQTSDVEGLCDLCSLLQVNVLMGEHLRDNAQYAQYLSRHALDSVRCRDVHIGGIGRMLEVAHLAESFGVNCEPDSWGNQITQAVHLHVMLSIRNCEFFELPVPAGSLDVEFADSIRIDKSGYVHAPTKPGLGIDINWEVVEKLTIRTICYPRDLQEAKSNITARLDLPATHTKVPSHQGSI